VADVEVSSDIWGGEDDAESALLKRLAVLLESRLKEALLHPPVVMSRLDLDRVIARP
jgi:hypothetical protein